MKTLSTLLFFFISSVIYAQNCQPAARFLRESYERYHIIGLDDGPQATVQTHAFIRSLLRDPEISNTIDYIIVEFANTSMQRVLDRYIAGEDIEPALYKNIWRRGTQATNVVYGEASVYQQLLETIHDLNVKNKRHKIRVIAGDPQIEWSSIKTKDEYTKSLSQVNMLPAKLAVRYGIDSGKHVLLIYGNAHFSRLPEMMTGDSTKWSIDNLVNTWHPHSMITIGALKADEQQAKDVAIPLQYMCNADSNTVAKMLNEKNDAVYYVGPATQWRTDDVVRIDKNYWPELNRRSILVWGKPINPNLKK